MPRTLATVTHAGGTDGTYELALDPTRSTLDTAIRVAGLAEAAGIDALFTADLLRFGAQGVIGAQEPLVFVSALSQVTSRIGLIATVSTTFHHPFNLARLFGTLDHVSNGRAAWNLVTSALGEENFGPGELPSPEQRYARAAETLEIVNALWDSWEPGALTLGPDGRAVLDPDRVHPIDHVGDFFSVAGPLNVPPLPQGRPVQIQAGQSAAGLELGARYAEVVFTSLPTLDVAQDFTQRIRARAAAESLLPALTSINGRRGRVEVFSRQVARGDTLRELVIAAQDTGHWTVAGTPEQLADAVEERFRAGVLDVISLNGLDDPRRHEFVVDGLLAELRRRGIVGPPYPGRTLRENLGLPPVGAGRERAVRHG